MKYIVKVAPEITIKSKPVRKQCIKLLSKNIRIHLDRFDGFFEVVFRWDRIDINFASLPDMDEEIQSILKNIPGIGSFMEVQSFPLLTPGEGWDNTVVFDNILEKASEFYLDKISDHTFVVRVNRSGLHNFSSIDLERYVGGGLLERSENAKVKLKDPDVKVLIEVKEDMFYIVKSNIEGVWWYPVWFQEKVVSLISGGFDSGVSTFSMMKRGCLVDYLFFNLWWSAHELWVKQVAYHLWENFSTPHKRARFITVNFEEVIQELLTKVHHKYRGIILKRFMLKISSMIAEEHYYAIVKWDSLWQVSSQTLKNMNVIDRASSTLVLRPLISHNKQEIVDISKDIGTYDFACNMPEYCGVISDKPATGARLEVVLEEEQQIAPEVLERAFSSLKVQFVKDIIGEYTSASESELDLVLDLSGGDIIIDIREEREKKKFPLIVDVDIVDIPFFEINHRFKDLDQSKQYLFYCEKGVLSRLYGLYLREKGFNNIKIFRKK